MVPLLVALAVLGADPVPFTAKVVGFKEDDSVVLHLERPLVRGQPAELYLVHVFITFGKPYSSGVKDMYEGLPEWLAAHPKATDAEWEAEARRLRGLNWKRAEEELRKVGVKFRSFSPLKQTAGWTRLPLPGLTTVLTRECETCDVFAERDGQRVAGAPGDLAGLYLLQKDVVVLTKSIQAKPDPMRLSGVFVIRDQELTSEARGVPGPPTPGATFMGRHGYVREAPYVGAPVATTNWTALIKVVGPTVGDYVKVSWVEDSPRWREGFLRLRNVEAHDPKLEAVLHLELEAGFVNTGGAWRYRAVVRNPTAAPVSLDPVELRESIELVAGGCCGSWSGTHTSKKLWGLEVPPKGELVILDGALQRCSGNLCVVDGERALELWGTGREGKGALARSSKLVVISNSGYPSAVTGATQRLEWPLTPELPMRPASP